MFQIENNSFQTIKVNFYKSPKNRNFCPCFMALFLISCFLANPAREERFLMFYIEKNAIEIFQTGQSMLFGQNWALFYFLFSGKSSQKNAFRQQKSTFKLFAKINHFYHFLFSSKSSQGRTFFMFQIEKNAFKTTKVNFSTSPKYRNFPKGLVHALRPQMAIVFIGCCWAASLRRLIERALSELDGICLSRGGYTVLYLKFNSQRNSYGYTQGGSSTVCRKTGNEK